MTIKDIREQIEAAEEQIMSRCSTKDPATDALNALATALRGLTDIVEAMQKEAA